MKNFYHDELVELPVVSYFIIYYYQTYFLSHCMLSELYGIIIIDIFKTNKSEGSLLVSSNPL